MKTFLYQINSDIEEAEMMGGACSLAIVEQSHFEKTGALRSDHILDELVTETKDPNLGDTLEELAESMFLSTLDPDETREVLNDYGIFKEAVLFPED